MLPIVAALTLILSTITQTPSPAVAAPTGQAQAIANEELWQAARAGDLTRAKQALERGADVNASTRYGATALTFAADRGHLELVKLLLERGADVNAQDTFYRMRALDMAAMNNHGAVALLLLEHGSKGAAGALMAGVQRGDAALVKAALASSDLTAANVNSALALAKRTGNAAMTELLSAKAASMPAAEAPTASVDRATLQSYAGAYRNGKILWERTAFTGIPRVKRHTKASQANSTPITDGRRVVALFGSIGMLAAWDMEGRPLWTRDVGVLDSGWFFDPDYQWGHSSSPIIYRNTVIVQADMQKDSFLAAYDLESGREVWRTGREEISTWGTPTLFRAGDKEQIVTNGTTIRAYDPASGQLLWTLGPTSEVTVGTPVVGDGLVYVTGGYPPVRPIYAVKPTASGEITLARDQTAHEALAWSNTEGTYIPTPLFYEGILYTCDNNGVLSAYDGKTGERIYRARVGGGGSFSASPVAADGRLYIANEDGDIFVVRAGPTYEELAKNAMKEVVMSTPAISDGLIVVRTLGHVYGIGARPTP